jgi:hypothetical protein
MIDNRQPLTLGCIVWQGSRMKIIPHRIIAVLLALTLPIISLNAQTSARTASSKLESLLLNEATWDQSPDEFMANAQSMRFVWTSDTKGSARSVNKGMSFLQKNVLETVATFRSNRIHTVLMSIYNKGDTAAIDLKDYKVMLESLNTSLSKLTGKRARPINSRRAKSVSLKSETLSWTKGNLAFILEFASSRTKDPRTRRIAEHAEYINLTMLKGDHRKVTAVAGDQKAQINLMTLKQKVKREANGDIYLANIPMVDQGQKGYCANATTERVLRYYGVEVNQHKLAQRARTAAGGGTSSAALLEALKAMAGMMYLRVNVMITTDARALMRTMKDYNKMAKKEKSPEIPIPRSGTLDMAAILKSMDSDIYVRSRTTNTTKVKQFAKNVQSKIDRGIPLLWSVTLGFVKETPALPQAFGGHMRLITGYNSKTSEIIYTDTWGKGHESKRMPITSAVAISTGLFSMEPMH